MTAPDRFTALVARWVDREYPRPGWLIDLASVQVQHEDGYVVDETSWPATTTITLIRTNGERSVPQTYQHTGDPVDWFRMLLAFEDAEPKPTTTPESGDLR